MKGDGVLLAHTLGVGGPDLELMVIAAAMAVLGIVFFFQKAVKPAVSFALIVVALGAGVLAFTMGGEDAQQPAASSEQTPGGASIEITSPSEGETLPANEEIEISYEIDPGELPPDELGDMHIYVDGELVSMQMTEVLTVVLDAGERSLAIEAAQPNHASFEPPIIHEIDVTAE